MLELGPFVYWESDWQQAESHARRKQCEGDRYYITDSWGRGNGFLDCSRI